MNAAIPMIGAGVLAGGALTVLGTRALVDERTPSKIAPVVTGLSIAAGAGAATYLTGGMPRNLLAGAAIGSVLTGAVLAARPQLAWNDRGGALAGVYDPERLIMIEPSVHVEGRVQRVSFPGDGDIHVVIEPDANSRRYVHGTRHPDTIIAEPVPDDQGRLQVPHPGDRIAVDGPLAWDSTHGWSEVHPVRNLTFLEADGPRTPRDAKDLRDVDEAAARAEHHRERQALVGGGIGLVGASLLVGGAFRGARAAGLLGGTIAPGRWPLATVLLAGGGIAAIAGALVGGQGRD